MTTAADPAHEDRPLPAVSLFTNCGAGDLGYERAGFGFRVLAEIEEHRLAVAQRNHPDAETIPGDLRETWPEVVAAYRRAEGEKAPDLLSACPPCQGMSTARAGRGKDEDAEAGARDPRNLLVLPIAKVAEALRPRIVVVENVAQFLTRKVPHPDTGEGVSAARLLLSMLAPWYKAFPAVVDMAEYGVPQHRVRTFITLVARDEDFLPRLLEDQVLPFPAPTHGWDSDAAGLVTLGEALRLHGIPPLDSESTAVATHGSLPLHRVPVLDEDRYAMVSAIPPNSGRSAWETDECRTCGAVDVGPDEATCPRCEGPLLRPVVKAPDGSVRLVKGFRNSTYRRMDPDSPAATVTTASNRISSDNTIHPWENRVLSAWECQILQGFPAGFQWGESLEAGHVGLIRAMIGEAVPPTFTAIHGEVLAALCRGLPLTGLMSASDERARKARRKLFGHPDRDP